MGKIKIPLLKYTIVSLIIVIVGGYLSWFIIRDLKNKAAKSDMALFANIRLDSTLVYLPNDYREELAHVDSLKARLVVDNQQRYEAFFQDYSLEEILYLHHKTDSGLYYGFRKPPRHFLCYPVMHPELHDSIAGITDMLWSSNPLYTIKLCPFYPYFAIRHYSPILESLRFVSLPRLFAERWYNPVALTELINSFHDPRFYPSDILIVYRNSDSPDIGFLYNFGRETELYGKVTQYPMLLTGQDRSKERKIFPTDNGCFYLIRPEFVKGPQRLFEWKPGQYIMWSGPINDSVSLDDLRRLTSIAIVEANYNVFKESLR